MVGLLVGLLLRGFPEGGGTACRPAGGHPARKQQALADLERSTAGINDLNRKLGEVQKAVAFFESKLPQAKEIDKILKEVWQMAEANSLQTKTIKTMNSQHAANYSEQPIEISLSGDFNGFYAFLLQLESSRASPASRR